MLNTEGLSYRHSTTVLLIRSLFLGLIVVGVVAYQSFNSSYVIEELYLQFYALLSISFLLHTFFLLSPLRLSRFVYPLLFLWEVVSVSCLVEIIDINQSVLIFMYYINIILCGISFGRWGGIAISLFTSMAFSIVLINNDYFNGYQLYLASGLNNLAFFTLAYLSGFISEQLSILGKELKETSYDLKVLRNLNSVILQEMSTGVVALNHNMQVIQYNQSACKILQQSQLEGLDFRDLLPGLTSDPIRQAEYVMDPGSNERRLTYSSSAISIGSHESNKGTVVVFEDVTELRKLQSQLFQNDKMAAIGELSAGIAHEIRNPLASISGSVQMLSAGIADKEEQKKLLAIIEKEVNRLNHLITEFLDYSRPEKLDLVDLNLVDVLNECVSLVNADPLSHEVHIELELEEDYFIQGNKDKLKQAFLNLMINAIQSMKESENKVLKLQLRKSLLTLSDTGCGISESDLERIFIPFHTTKKNGTGLGLPIVHSILQTHQIDLSVKSELGLGTEFQLKLPHSKTFQGALSSIS